MSEESWKQMMVLAYQSKEFGFGMNLTENELSEDNQYQMGKEYAGKDAATEYLGSPLKKKPIGIITFHSNF